MFIKFCMMFLIGILSFIVFEDTREIQKLNLRLSYIESLNFLDVKSTIRDEVYMIKGSLVGTGFQVSFKDKKYIISNEHVCGSKVKKVLVTNNRTGKKVYKKILKQSSVLDLCVIEGFRYKSSLVLEESPPALNEKVAVFGHPSLNRLTSLYGEIISTGENLKSANGMLARDCIDNNFEWIPNLNPPFFGVCARTHKNLIYTTLSIFPGSSGSPAINTKGKVVGVVVSAKKDTGWGSLISSHTVIQFLDKME